MHTFRFPLLLFLLSGAAFTIWIFLPKSAEPTEAELSITAWNVQWIDASNPSPESPLPDGDWHAATVAHPLADIPDEAIGAWVHLTVPPTSTWRTPALYIERLYGLDYTVFADGQPLHRSTRDYDFERKIALIPLPTQSSESDIYVRIESKERAGISSPVRIGEFDALSAQNVRKELPNLLLGAAIAFAGFVLLSITVFLLWKHRKQTVALSLFILSTGLMIATYSSMPFFYYPEFGPTLLFLFDTSMLVVFPSLFYFVVHLYADTFAIGRKAARWLIGYSLICFLVLVLYRWVGDSLYFYYKLFTFWILAPLILVQLIVIVALAFRSVFRGNPDSALLSTGIIGLSTSGIVDLVLLSVLQRPYVLVLWKFGIVLLIVCLVMILIRRVEADYSRLLAYSRELELHSRQLQKTERMRIVSDLAASIAHEIRNPLQVTRGFLQLLTRHANENTKHHYAMAISELDRASGIISDFLTFAKPEQDTIVTMDVKQELSNIETIIGPMVVLYGGVLRVNAADRLYMKGNVSKFKQAIINMMKNSIESFQEEGQIEIDAYAEGASVVIRIADNGAGMEEEQIAKLGEPYFSTKTKGTGLGLMVTFRIIEVMKGTLEFRSTKGEGTEALLRFPLVQPD